jgi:hypothetical protein
VPEAVAFHGRVLSFQPTEKGARGLFGDTSPKEGYWVAANFLTAGEFRRESGGIGTSVWGRGSLAGRALAGGLVRRAVYSVKIAETPQGVELRIESDMSGWEGSVLGVAREHSQRKAFIARLQSYLISLSAAAPTQTAPGSQTVDPASTLERLRDLRDRDLITEAEYTAKRTEIVSRL